jgi:hypothetical protein
MQQVIVTPPAPPAPPVLATTSPEQALRLVDAQINGLKQEISELTGQLTNGISDARESAIETQIERAEEQLEQLERVKLRLLGAEEERPVVAQRTEDGIPPSVQSVIESVLVAAVAIALGLPLIRLWARRMENRHATAPANDPRLERLEQAVDAVAIEVERISEGQRYSNKLLGELRALPAPNPLEQWPAQREHAELPARPARP